MATSPALRRSCSSSSDRFREEIEKEELRFEEVFEGNRRWIDRMKTERPTIFEELSIEQKPRYLFIGCSDSRVPAQEITGLHTGELFVHRNISNLVVNTDINVLSVLHFAIDYLKVKHIIGKLTLWWHYS
jgi:carbonic anhydrase